jgi:hypothetical protein
VGSRSHDDEYFFPAGFPGSEAFSTGAEESRSFPGREPAG